MPRMVGITLSGFLFDLNSFCLSLPRWVLDIIPNKYFYCIALIIINPRIRDGGVVKET